MKLEMDNISTTKPIGLSMHTKDDSFELEDNHFVESEDIGEKEVLKKLLCAQIVSYIPSIIFLIMFALPLFAMYSLLFPTVIFPAVDVTYEQFQVKDHPTTEHLLIYDALSTYNFNSITPLSSDFVSMVGTPTLEYINSMIDSVSDSILYFSGQETSQEKEQREILNFIESYNMKEKNNERQYGDNTIQAVDAERSQSANQQLLLVYKAKKKHDNLLTTKYLNKIHDIENNIMNYNKYSDYCVLNDALECHSLVTVVNYFFPTVIGGDIIFDGKGTELANIDDVIDILLSSNALSFFDLQFNEVNRHAEYIVSIVKFGLPRVGYTSKNDRYSQQSQEIVDFINSMDSFLSKQTNNDLYVIYAGGDIMDNQFNDAIYSDALLAFFSVGFIFFYSYIHTKSLFLTVFGLLGVILSFPPTIMAHVYVFGDTISFLTGISLWIILGIGADDIFVFVDIYRQTPKQDIKGNAVPRHLRLASTYRKAGSAMLATSITTALAFFGSTVSKIPPIQQFGFFMGCLVSVNYILVMTYFPAILMIYIKYIIPMSRTCCKCCPRICCRKSGLGTYNKKYDTDDDENNNTDNKEEQGGTEVYGDEDNIVFKRQPSEADRQISSFEAKVDHKTTITMMKYFDIIYKLRYIVIILSFGFVFFMAYQVPYLQPPAELPQFLPLDHNIELLRATDGYLPQEASTTSSSSYSDTNWDSGSVSGGGSGGGGTTVVTPTSSSSFSSSSNYVICSDCPILLNNACFPVKITDPSSTSALGAISAPRSVTITPVSGVSVSVSWLAPTLNLDKCVGYAVFISADNGTTWGDYNYVSVSTLSYTFTGLLEMTEYTARIVGYDSNVVTQTSCDFGIVSNPGYGSTIGNIPDSATAFQLDSLLSNQVSLSWTAPIYTGADNGASLVYELKRDGIIIQSGITSISYIDTSTCGGISYTYILSTSNIYGVSLDTLSLIVVTPISSPIAPTLNSLFLGLSPDIVTVNYDAPTCNNGANIINYNIETSIDNGVSWTNAFTTTGAVTGAQDVSLLTNTNYDIRVRAVNSVGQGTASNAKSIITPRDVPLPPVGVVTTIDNNNLLISWTLSDEGFSSVTDITIQIDTGGGVYSTYSIITLPATDATVTGLTRITTYNFKLNAINSYGASVYSSIISGTTDPDPPAVIDAITVPLVRRRLLFIKEEEEEDVLVNDDDYDEIQFEINHIDNNNIEEKKRIKIGRKLLATSTPLPLTSSYPLPTHSISWTAPDAGGGTILSYQIKLHVITDPVEVYTIAYEGINTNCIIEVRYGIEYDIAIRTQNEAGFNAWGTSVTLIIRNYIPEIPIVQIGTITPLSIEYIWDIPYDNGNIITGYEGIITYSDTTTQIISFNSIDIINTIITGLTPLSTVTFSIQAINSVGKSDASVISGTTSAGAVIGFSNSNGVIINNNIITQEFPIDSNMITCHFHINNDGNDVLSVSNIEIVSQIPNNWLSYTFPSSSIDINELQSYTISMLSLINDVNINYIATLRITHNGVVTAPSSIIELNYTGVGAFIQFSTSTITGNVVETSTTVDTQTIIVTNTGLADLIVTSINKASWLTIQPTAFTILPGLTRTLTLTFKSLTNIGGDYSSDVILNHNLLGDNTTFNTFSSTLHVINRALVFNVSSISETVSYPTTSISILLQLSAISANTNPTISSITTTGSLTGLLSVSSHSVPLSIPFGMVDTMTLIFDTSTKLGGAYTGDIIITHDSLITGTTSIIPYTIIIQAASYSQNIDLISLSSHINSNAIQTKSIIISNTGTSALTVTGSIVTPGATWISLKTTNSFIVNPLSDFTFQVDFDSTGLITAGTYSAAIELTHDGPTAGQISTVNSNFIIQEGICNVLNYTSNVTILYEDVASIVYTHVEVQNTGDYDLIISNIQVTSSNELSVYFNSLLPVLISPQASDILTFAYNYGGINYLPNSKLFGITLTHDGRGTTTHWLSERVIKPSPVISILTMSFETQYITSVDTYAIGTIRISNTGTDNLILSSIDIYGDLSTSSSTIIDALSSLTITAGSIVNWQFKFFVPTTIPGSYSGTITLGHNDASSNPSSGISYTIGVYASTFLVYPSLLAYNNILYNEQVPEIVNVIVENRGLSNVDINNVVPSDVFITHNISVYPFTLFAQSITSVQITIDYTQLNSATYYDTYIAFIGTLETIFVNITIDINDAILTQSTLPIITALLDNSTVSIPITLRSTSTTSITIVSYEIIDIILSPLNSITTVNQIIPINNNQLFHFSVLFNALGTYTGVIRVTHSYPVLPTYVDIGYEIIVTAPIYTSTAATSYTQTLRSGAMLSVPKSFTITNTGDANLFITSCSFASQTNSWIYLVDNNIFGQPIAPSESRIIQINIDASSLQSGIYNSVMYIIHNAPVSGQTIEIPFTLTVNAPNMILSGIESLNTTVSLAFTTIYTVPLIISNTGDIELTISSMSGSSLPWLNLITSASTQPFVIAAGSTMDVSITYDGVLASIGDNIGQLTIQHDSPTSAQIDIYHLNFQKVSRNYITIDVTSISHTIVVDSGVNFLSSDIIITNTGDLALNIASLTFISNSVIPTYSYTFSNSLDTFETLNSLETSILTIIWDMNLYNLNSIIYQFNIIFNHDSIPIIDVPVTINVIQADISYKPDTFMISRRYGSNFNEDISISILNNGTSELSIISILETSPVEYNWVTLITSSILIQPSNTDVLTLHFLDSSSLLLSNSPYMNRLLITHNAKGATSIIPIELTLLSPVISLTTLYYNINVTSVVGGQIVTISDLLYNIGDYNLVISTILSNVAWLSASVASTTISNNTYTTITMDCDSVSQLIGTYSGMVTITHDAPIVNSVTEINIDFTILGAIQVNSTSNIYDILDSNAVYNDYISLTNTHASSTITVTITNNNVWLNNNNIVSIDILPLSTYVMAYSIEPSTLALGTTTTGAITYSYIDIGTATIDNIVQNIHVNMYNVPNEPINIQIVSVSTAELVIQWQSGNTGTVLEKPDISYEIDYKLANDPDNNNYVNVYNDINLISNIISVSPLHEYTLRIRAKNIIGYSSYNKYNVTANGNVPNSILLDSFVHVGNDYITINWIDSVNPLTGYERIYNYIVESRESGLGDNYIQVGIFDPTSVSSQTGNIINSNNFYVSGKTYDFRIISVNGAGSSPVSNKLTITLPTCLINNQICNGYGNICYLNDYINDNIEQCICTNADYYGLLCDNHCPIDPVSSLICSDNGICNTTTSQCECISNAFIGPYCEICPTPAGNQGPCDSFSSNGSCYWDIDSQSAQCQCSTNYIGLNCVSCLGISNGESCYGHGECITDIDLITPICDCNPTHTGGDCSLYCPDGCSNHGVCTELTNGIQCVCDDLHVGDNCGVVCPIYNNTACNNHGTCALYNNTSVIDSVCTCEDDYKGNACELGCPGLDGLYALSCSGNGLCSYNTTNNNIWCECDLGYSGDDCSSAASVAPASSISTASSINMIFIWGIDSADGTNIIRTDPSSVAVPIYDDTFNLSDPKAQEFLFNFCNDIIIFYKDKLRPEELDCFMIDFAESMSSTNTGFPVSADIFDYTFYNWLLGTRSSFGDNVGFVNGKVSWVTVRSITYIKAGQSGSSLQPTYDYWENFIKQYNKKAPSSINKGIQFAYEWPRMVVEIAFIEGITVSLSVALFSAFLSIIVFTGNVYLSFLATIIMFMIIISMLGFFVLMGWSLGAIEAVSLSIVVGLSIDYALHLGHAYVHSDYRDRKRRAMAATIEIGSSVLASSVTTMGSMIVLLFCLIYTFFVIGTIVAMTVLFAICFSLGTFIVLLSVCGPEKDSGDISVFLSKYILCCFVSKDEYIKEEIITFDNNNDANKNINDIELNQLTSSSSSSSSLSNNNPNNNDLMNPPLPTRHLSDASFDNGIAILDWEEEEDDLALVEVLEEDNDDEHDMMVEVLEEDE